MRLAKLMVCGLCSLLARTTDAQAPWLQAYLAKFSKDELADRYVIAQVPLAANADRLLAWTGIDPSRGVLSFVNASGERVDVVVQPDIVIRVSSEPTRAAPSAQGCPSSVELRVLEVVEAVIPLGELSVYGGALRVPGARLPFDARATTAELQEISFPWPGLARVTVRFAIYRRVPMPGCNPDNGVSAGAMPSPVSGPRPLVPRLRRRP